MNVPEIAELARRIARSDPEDAAEQKTLRQLLAALRERVQGEKAHDVRLRLDSALLLTEYMATLGAGGGGEILRIVSRLIASLETFFNPAVTIRKPRGGEEPLEGLLARRAEEEAETKLDGPSQDEQALVSDMLLGEILVQFGTINSTQVCQALELQNERNIRFGEALIELGAATRADVMSAIACQDTMRREAGGKAAPPSAALPSFRPLRRDLKLVTDMLLGDLLVRMGKITPEQLEKGLRAHRATGVRIGEALVQMGATTWKAVEEAMRIQSERRVSVL